MTTDEARTGLLLGARFMEAFNDIEDHFRHALQHDERVSFHTMLGEYEQKYRLPTEQRKALKAMARLRNTISHSSYRGGRPIAEPVAEVVDEISRLRDQILTPPLVWDCLDRRDVSVTTPETPIRAVLELIHRHDYSQVPVYGGKRYVGLLTTNCIARWLADRLDGTALAGDEPVEAVLKFAEPSDIALHVTKSTTAAVAVDLLSQAGSDGYRPAALIVTRTGHVAESALAVVVGYDLPALNAALSLPRRVR